MEQESIAKEPRQGFKKYLLEGIVSTGILIVILDLCLGGALGFIANLHIDALNKAWFGSELGSAALSFLSNYSIFIGSFVIIPLFMFLVKPWRPFLKALGPAASGNRPSMLLLGLLIGFAQNGLCVLVAALTGCFTLEFKQFSLVGTIVFLVFIFIQSSAEEFACRGFAYQRIKRTYNPTVAIVASSVLFMAAHLANDGLAPVALLNLVLVGVLYALFVRYFDSIWIAMGAHTAWNFTQNIFFGLPNSGTPSAYAIFAPTGALSSGFAYDTAFGVEGSLLCTVVYVVSIAAVLWWGRTHVKPDLDACADEKPVAPEAPAA